jgi:hypothetical protein
MVAPAEQSTEWLHVGLTARCMVTLIAGHLDTGVNFFVAEEAARASRGREPGDGANYYRKPIKILYISRQHMTQQVIFRLTSQDADFDNFVFLTEQEINAFTLSDIDKLEALLEKHKDIAMIVIEGAPGFLGRKKNENFNNIVRPIIINLKRLARQRHISILLTGTATNKGDDADVYQRFLGASAWSTEVDIFAVLSAYRDKQIVFRIRNNECNGPRIPNQIFKISSDENDGVYRDRLEWMGAAPEDVVDEDDEVLSPKRLSAMEKAEAWLDDFLKQGEEWEREKLFDIAKHKKISKNSIYDFIKTQAGKTLIDIRRRGKVDIWSRATVPPESWPEFALTE